MHVWFTSVVHETVSHAPVFKNQLLGLFNRVMVIVTMGVFASTLARCCSRVCRVRSLGSGDVFGNIQSSVLV